MKFEKDVAAFPGITRAKVNFMAQKLVVEGASNIDAIRQLAVKHNYTVHPVFDQKPQAVVRPKIHWERRRAVASGLTLAIAYGVEKLGGSAMVFIPLYIAAMVMGGWGNFQKAARSLPRGSFNMSVLMSLAAIPDPARRGRSGNTG